MGYGCYSNYALQRGLRTLALLNSLCSISASSSSSDFTLENEEDLQHL